VSDDTFIQTDTQSYFKIEESETTVFPSGNTISTLKIHFNDGACITLHHHDKIDKTTVNIHQAQLMDLAIFNKITKKLTKYDDDCCWTDIKVVE